MPITLMCGKGSQSRNHTAAAANATKAMRTSSVHSTPCPCSSCSGPGSGSFSSGDFRVSLRYGGLAGDFSMMGEELIATFPPCTKAIFQVKLDHQDSFHRRLTQTVRSGAARTEPE